MPVSVGQPQLRPVRALLTNAGGGKACLWIHEADVSWLVTYLAEEVAAGHGGPLTDSDTANASDCAEAGQAPLLDAAVAAPCGSDLDTPTKTKKGGHKIRWWDFDSVWEAVITKGPLTGRTCVCKVADLTPEKWAAVANVHKFEVDFERATFQEKKTAARHFLELYLKRCGAE